MHVILTLILRFSFQGSVPQTDDENEGTNEGDGSNSDGTDEHSTCPQTSDSPSSSSDFPMSVT